MALPRPSILLYSHVEDVWEHRVREWLARAAESALSGRTAWLVCGSYVQAHWLRSRALEEGQHLFGVRFMDLRELRHQLCRRVGLPSPAFGRESLVLLLKSRLDESRAGSALASQVLDALDELALSGWLAAHGLEAAVRFLRIPGELHPLLREIVESPYWRPAADRSLVAGCRPDPTLSVAIFGLDQGMAFQIDLLCAAARSAGEFVCWLAQPFRSESLYQRWVERLEDRLNTEFEPVPAGSCARPFEPLTERFNHFSDADCRRPELIETGRWSDHIDAAVALVQQRLQQGDRRIALVVPERSASGPAIVQRLIDHRISVADEYRSTILPALPELAQRWLTEWIEGDRGPEKVLELARLLFRSDSAYADFRSLLYRRFDERPTRSMGALAPDQPWMIRLLELAQGLPSRAGWQDYLTRWSNILDQFQAIVSGQEFIPVQLSVEPLQPNWHELTAFLGQRPVDLALFLRSVREAFAERASAPNPEASHRFAPVLVSTPARLQATSWDGVIFLDAVGDRWTASNVQESMLTDRFRAAARQEGHLFVTYGEEVLRRSDQYLQLLLHARRFGAVVFFRTEETGEEVTPNDFVTFLQVPLKTATRTATVTGRRKHGFDDARFVEAFRRRRDPTRPFDEYSLNFSGLPLPQREWSASALQRLVAAPGSFAFETVLGARRCWTYRFERRANAVLGKLVHASMQRIFGGTESFAELEALLGLPAGRTSSRQAGSVESLSRTGGTPRAPEPGALQPGELIERLQSVAQAALARLINNWPDDDPWWQSLYRKAQSYVDRMLRGMVTEAVLPSNWCQAEARVQADVRLSQEDSLRLIGRMDLVLANQPAWSGAEVVLVDFKTTAVNEKINSQTGAGFQFVAYQRIAETLGATVKRFLVVGGPEIAEVRNEEPETLESAFRELAIVQQRSSFGHGPVEPAEFGIREELPIATAPVNRSVLAAKLALTRANPTWPELPAPAAS
jgi:PD-(D/E)XK nuclease superfamily